MYQPDLSGFQGSKSKIMLEELGDYFSGNLTEDMLIDHLANRVELYLLEQK